MKHAFKNGLKIITNKQIQESRKRLSKKVLNTQTGIFYKSAKEAAMELQINKNTLYGYLSGKSLNITSLIYA
jgi:DNA-binding NtrC family response regulator